MRLRRKRQPEMREGEKQSARRSLDAVEERAAAVAISRVVGSPRAIVEFVSRVRQNCGAPPLLVTSRLHWFRAMEILKFVFFALHNRFASGGVARIVLERRGGAGVIVSAPLVQGVVTNSLSIVRAGGTECSGAYDAGVEKNRRPHRSPSTVCRSTSRYPNPDRPPSRYTSRRFA